ncbi:MAG TPA: molybdopterin-binding protein [Croceibacterium sp.]|nr:molybdopterin-binding protein [Croceibacterium sp.]
MQRRNVLAGLAALVTAGCSKIGDSRAFAGLVDGAEKLHRGAHRVLGGRRPMAREFSAADISPFFRGNGSTDVGTPTYYAHRDNGFADWTLEVRGLVERPLSLTMAQIRALPQRTQITRHDCVEGWSAIGQWTGPQLSAILALARVKEAARFAVFRCADTLGGAYYYESCDMDDALHPQTLIAHALNGEPLPVRNGAPLRLRIERQLGYKHAKYLTAIELVDSFAGIEGGGGGYWEDRGYQWYAGI